MVHVDVARPLVVQQRHRVQRQDPRGRHPWSLPPAPQVQLREEIGEAGGLDQNIDIAGAVRVAKVLRLQDRARDRETADPPVTGEATDQRVPEQDRVVGVQPADHPQASVEGAGEASRTRARPVCRERPGRPRRCRPPALR
ncbi:hypothetical protein C5E02_06145 [Rathayibacter rathayi]|uniref:Uncharacterized protein n=1 Tax=Rathayibacter rathayi TaxID=33887 RepID=A0ABX5ABX0_RATRA|nr:hypothetical protein C1O28_06375 [Rathayibacter rathayi]PPF24768.1 hypothetical protein C5C34_04430 [Rathayibacter rathayi]PPF49535.1 hypothetical protein C5C08_07180 [Rathayibacter rathayi]PPF80252.1 hypothetical protein C5C14_07020 [Rathayibacter rathayi]PPG15768.1 hypothetical protein C5C11_02000 [Rathayibacter rathayi]